MRLLLLALVLAVVASNSSLSQEKSVPTSGGSPRVMRAGAVPGGPPTRPSGRPAKPDAKNKKKGPGGKGAKPDASKGKPEEEKKNIQRPDKPPTPADPKELQVKPDKAGLVQFSFRGQAWPDVLEWLA